MQYRWSFDVEKQLLLAPSGWTISVHEIATDLHERVQGRRDLTGPWSGWKQRGQFIKGPGGIRVTPSSLQKFYDRIRDNTP